MRSSRSTRAVRLAHDAHSLAGLDREADVFEHIELAVRVAERQVPEFHAALHIGQIRHAGTVSHINGGIQQLGDAVEGRLATGGFFNEHGHGHDGPDDGLKVTDVLHQLARVELPDVDKIAAKTQDHAEDRLHKQGDHDLQKACWRFSQVLVIVLPITVPMASISSAGIRASSVSW